MMPTFYFHLRGEGYDVPDLAGQSYPDENAARAEAERLAAELVEQARLAGTPPADAIIELVDSDLRPVLALPLREAAG